MRVKNLKLRNFRNYTDVNLEFEKGVNYIQGDNGSGKTSLVEAIGLLSMCKSIRTSDEKEVIKCGEESASVNAEVENQINNQIKIVISQNGKYIELDGNDVKKVSNIAGIVKIVSFLPKDVELFKQSPSKRRKFIDANLSMVNSKYLRVLSEYNHFLGEIRELVKEDSFDEIALDVLIKEISKRGYSILEYRKQFISWLNEKLKVIGKYLQGDENAFVLKYQENLKSINSEKDYCASLSQQIKKDLLKDKYRIIISGIHLDDLSCEYNGLDLSIYGSQGQNRISVIALKLSLYELIKEKFKTQSIVILDDVLSELEYDNQTKLIKYLTQVEQVFITGTKFDLEIPVSLFTVKNNNVWRNN